jgi:Na+/melibiose symporter-like transporter
METHTATQESILGEIGKQLSERRGLLAQRTFLLIWPILMLVFVGPIVALLGEENLQLWQILTILGFIIFAFCYQIVVGAIFAIEKRIWLDSYFDNRPLAPQQSWRIAFKLLRPAINLVFRTAFIYYLLPSH